LRREGTIVIVVDRGGAITLRERRGEWTCALGDEPCALAL
jgi:hypothetical protein